MEALKAKLLKYFNQKVTNTWEEFRNEHHEREVATGVAAAWGNFNQETVQAEFENSKHYPQVCSHLAPCSTFSRARGRAQRTRARSHNQPAGIRPHVAESEGRQ